MDQQARSDEKHSRGWDVVEAGGSGCQLKDLAPLSNHHGTVAVLRKANCPGHFAQGRLYNVIFIHRAGEANDRENLAFQYTPWNDKLWPLPSLVWTSPSQLTITVPDAIDAIVIQKAEIGGTQVVYKLPQ